MMITSTSNKKIKEIRKLHQRKDRQASGLCYVEGLRNIGEACQQSARIKSLLVAPELLSSEFALSLLEQQRLSGVEIIEMSAGVFSSISIKDRPKGMAAVIYQQWMSLSQVEIKPGDIWVALEAVQDPGNLGTILRTLDAVAGKGVIILDQSTDAYDATSIRASMGAIFSQRLARASFSEFSAWKQQVNVPVIGTSDAAEVDYLEIDYPPAMVLLMGSERQGLSERYLALCDAIAAIPMAGRSDSLNLSVATAVVLYEIFNRRRSPGKPVV